MSSALSITRSVNPPRAAFLDYPLGHTVGKAHEPDLQRELLGKALRLFETQLEPGQIVELPYHWAETDDWKVLRPSDNPADDDNRTARVPNPVYQSDQDQVLADAALAAGGCEGCVYLD